MINCKTILSLFMLYSIIFAYKFKITYNNKNSFKINRLFSNKKDVNNDLINKLYVYLLDKCNISTENKVHILMSVSGGVDSMAMLHLLSDIRKNKLLNIDLSVVNFNHKARQQSETEAKFVRDWSNKYNIPFYLIELPPNSSRHNESGFQEFARSWRKQECIRISNENNLNNNYYESIISTAHHKDDQIETILMKLLRGVHISNLYPMLPRSNCGKFIKPLLDIKKDELVKYMNDNSFNWYEDSSNNERKYKRNRVRLDLIPLMQELAGGSDPLQKRLMQLADQSLEINALINIQSKDFINEHVKYIYYNNSITTVDINLKQFYNLSKLIQSTTISYIVNKAIDKQLDFDRLVEINNFIHSNVDITEKCKSYSLNQHWNMIKYHNQYVCITNSHIKYKINVLKLDNNINIIYPDSIKVQVSNSSHDISDSNCVNLYNIPSNSVLVLRHPREGDIFNPINMNSSKKLVSFLRSKDIPNHLRDRVLVLLLLENKSVNDVNSLYQESLEIHNKIIAVPPYFLDDYSNREFNSINLKLEY